MAQRLLLQSIVKTFLLLVLALSTAFVWQRSRDHASESAPQTEKASATTVSPTPRAVYEHDWAKHSIDRAHAVTDEVRQTRNENDQP